MENLQMILPKKYAGATPGWTLHLARIVPQAPIYGFSIRADGKDAPIASAGVYVSSPVVADYDGGFTVAEVEANATLLHDSPRLAAAVVGARETLRAVSGFLLDNHPDEHNDGLFRCGCEHAMMYRKVMDALESTKEWEA